MSKVTKKKYYRPGTLAVPGTKITLKTQPYTNGVIFNIDDPISSFRSYLSLINLVLDGYVQMENIQGIDQVIPKTFLVNQEQIAKLKLLINYLVESPIEIILKEQAVEQDLLNNLEVTTDGR